MKIVINVAAIRDGSILLVKKKNRWILPGGKMEEGENELNCVLRECSEELPSTKVTIAQKYRDFKGITPFSNQEVLVRVYFGIVEGKLKPSSEISEAHFVSQKESDEISLSDITQKIINSLIKDGHL